MKNFKNLFYATCVVSTLFLSGCNDDKNDDPQPAPIVQKTKKDIITAKTWQINKIKLDGIDVTSLPEAATMKNTRTKLNTDGTFKQTTTGSTYEGVWQFQYNDTRLVFDQGTADEEQWDITELIENSLKMRTTYIDNGNTILVELEMSYAE